MSPAEKKMDKRNKRFYILGLMVVCLFAFIVQKELEVPKAALYPTALVGLFYLLARSLRTPLPAFYIMVCYVPFSKILVGDFGSGMLALNLTNILMMFVLIGMVSQTVQRRMPFFGRNSLNFPIILFCLLTIFSLIRGSFFFGYYYDVPKLIIEMKRWLTPILLFFLTFNSLEKKDSVRTTVKIMMTVVVITGLMAAWDYMNVTPGTSLDKARIGGITTKSNQLAAFFVYYMFLFLGFFYTHITSLRYWGMLFPLLIAFRGLQVTFSRGGYLGFAFGLYCITFFRSKAMFFFLCFTTIIVFLNPWMLPKGIQYRLGKTIEDGATGIYNRSDFEDSLEASSKRRIEVWRAGWEMIKDEPLLGWGYGSFPGVIASYDRRLGGYDAHNTYVLLAAESGIPTVLAFLLIIGAFFKDTHWVYKRSKDNFFRSTALGTLGGIGGLIMINVFGSRLNSLEVSGYLWILAGVILKMKRIEIDEQKVRTPIKKKSKTRESFDPLYPKGLMRG